MTLVHPSKRRGCRCATFESQLFCATRLREKSRRFHRPALERFLRADLALIRLFLVREGVCAIVQGDAGSFGGRQDRFADGLVRHRRSATKEKIDLAAGLYGLT